MAFQMTFQRELGRNLRMERMRANLSREDVAARMLADVCPGTVGSWETGARPIPIDKLVDFCRVIGQQVQAVWPMEGRQVQVIRAPRLRAIDDQRLQPLAAWARNYGDGLIRLTPEAIEAAAQLCGVPKDWLQRRLLKLKRF